MSQTHSLNPSFNGRVPLSAVSALYVDRFGRSLRFCNLEFDEETIFYGFKAHFRVYSGGGGGDDCRELSICGHCGPF